MNVHSFKQCNVLSAMASQWSYDFLWEDGSSWMEWLIRERTQFQDRCGVGAGTNNQLKACSCRDPAHHVNLVAAMDPVAGVAPSSRISFSCFPLPAISSRDLACQGQILLGWAVLGTQQGWHGFQAWGLHILMGECASCGIQGWGECLSGSWEHSELQPCL